MGVGLVCRLKASRGVHLTLFKTTAFRIPRLHQGREHFTREASAFAENRLRKVRVQVRRPLGGSPALRRPKKIKQQKSQVSFPRGVRQHANPQVRVPACAFMVPKVSAEGDDDRGKFSCPSPKGDDSRDP